MELIAANQSTDPNEAAGGAVLHLMGELVEALGVKGVLVLLALGSLYLMKFKPVRELAAAALKRLARMLVRYVRISLWAASKRMPIRLAYRLQPDRWRQMCEDRKLKGLKRGRVKRTPMGVDVLVTLNGAMTLEALNAHVKDLETGLGVRRGAIRIEGRDKANKATVRITVRNPLAKPVRWDVPVGPVSIKGMHPLSMNPFGEWTELDLQQRILVVGASGSGKSSVQRVLSAPVILAEDADLEVWDLKQGTESQHYEGLADVRITTADECRQRIEYLLKNELPRRAKVMKQLRTSTWPTSPQHRDRVVMVDEMASLVRDLDDDDLAAFFTFLEQARAFGIYVWIACQFPKASNLPTELRSQMSCTIALKMRRMSESRVVFEDLTKEGWAPHRLPGKGWLMVLDDDHDEPAESRAAWLDETAFRKLQAPAGPAAPVDGETLVIDLTEAEAADQADTLEVPVPELAPEDAVLAFLESTSEPVKVPQVVEATGLTRTRAYEILKVLIDNGRATQPGRGLYAKAA